jgi:endonuclease YncB( thermonuclease family)
VTRLAPGRPAIAVALLALTALVSGLVLVPTAAGAGTFQRVRVIRVMDGDTIDVDSNGDHHIDERIRLLGLDAPEHGLCNFQASKNALKSLVRHKMIELRSQQGRTGIMLRPERRVIVPVAGKMVDAATWMLQRGWAVWMPRAGETDHVYQQHVAADEAAATGLGWFNSTRCGAGPYAGAALTMQVEYLSDATNTMTAAQKRNQEFIRIRNDSTEPVDIDGWTLRVGNDRHTRVPAGGPIPPGAAVDIHVGFGTNTLTDRYLDSSVPMLVNAAIDGGTHLGSGSYLIDPQDDIRAHSTWPCTLGCVDPSGGALHLSSIVVDPPGPDSQNVNGEVVRITNSGSTPVNLEDYVLEEFPFIYEFKVGDMLAPGTSMTVRAGHGSNDSNTRFLGAPVPPLHNDGGRVLLRTWNAIVVDCARWGSGRCPPGSGRTLQTLTG